MSEKIKAPRPFAAGLLSLMAVLAVLAGAGTVIVGAGSLSQATLGVGSIGVGCALGILARIFQAAAWEAEARAQYVNLYEGMAHLSSQLDAFLSRLQ